MIKKRLHYILQNLERQHNYLAFDVIALGY